MNRLRLPLVILAALAVSSPRAGEAGPSPADAGPLPPRFDVEPFGAEKTSAPTAAEWKPTQPVALTSSSVKDCRAYRLREWAKIRCSKMSAASIALLGGTREGVSLFVDPPQWEGGIPNSGEMMFPVRRGDERVFEWSIFGDSYEGVGAPESGFLVSESWAPGDPAPVIIAQ